ncbi:hypothetical protein CANARDRAFT_203725 [[Candida] arabinofermentans NRRL YB-2248]|uniref:Bacterial surface antigen (D15) domain-containing protein n=1 Tax=[Candida] arabinofermentans NRRL YB-2248 TaxID=983967 RepID=A0A1E4SUP7_9ASCO|nr:hypothetical protein CANARDRAFT_203725 [[Candida] arabinofermentans NRRL YB-2248]
METFATPEVDKLTPLQELELKRQNIIMDYNKLAMEEVLKLNATRPVRIVKLNLYGAGNHFRDSFLTRQLEPMLKNCDSLTTTDFLKRIDLTSLNFSKMGVISNIAMNFDESKFKNPFVSNNTLELIANVQIIPVKKFFMKVGTNLGNGEGDGYVTLQWKNIFGGGESLNFDTNLTSNEIGKTNKSQYLFNYSMPLMNHPDFKYDCILYHSSRLLDYTTYHEQSINGITNKFSSNLGFINHELSIENLIRSIKLVSPNNDTSYRNNSLINDYYLFGAGDNFKSSLSYSLSYDTRDNTILPRLGSSFKISSELSMFPLNSSFIKTMLQITQNKTIGNNIFNFNFKTGLIHSLNNDLKIHPMDKFQLGGANDIRGFQINGLGPKQMGLTIGGDAFFGCGLSMFNKLPFLNNDSNFKFHSFINSGKLVNKNNLNNLFNNFNISSGVGLVYASPMARFELNFVVPIAVHHGDDLRKGIQYGIGLSFM